MKHLPLFVILSLVLHLALFGIIMTGLSKRSRPAYEVYEVAIVSSPVSSGSEAPSRPSSAPVTEPVAGFGKITKETVKEKSPSFKPIDLESKRMGSKSKVAQSQVPEASPSPWATEEGTAAAGRAEAIGEAVKMQVWVTNVIARFRDVWRPPQGVPLKKDLQATLNIRVSRTGEILSSQVLVSSRNMPYDKSVEFALNKIKRLPVPPIGEKPYEDFQITFVPPSGY